MNCEEFVARLEGVSKTASGWQARCPAHPDDTASMSVSEGKDGRVLVHCFAGCSADAIVGALGLKMSDLMPQKEKQKSALKRKFGKWVCDYEYQDERGVVIYKSSRYIKDDGHKTFVMSHPDPESKYGWSFGLTDANIKRVPFRLPRVIATAKAGKTIVIVEGEKDVLSVEKLGLTATCNVGGAGKWGHDFPPKWGRWFDGAKQILIIADNDEKNPKLPGQRHAWDVMRKISDKGVKARFKLMVMPQVEGQPFVKDFTDWVEARSAAGLKADIAALKEAISSAPPWPVEWQFDGEGVALPPVDEKSNDDEDVTEVGSDEDSARARFGSWSGKGAAPSPFTPLKDRRYKVDYDVGGKSVKINMCGNACLAEGIVMWQAKVRAKKDARMTARQENEIASIVSILWLRARGRFFWDEKAKGFSTSMYFDIKTGVLMMIRSDEFASFLATAANVNRESPTFRFMLAAIDDAAISSEVSSGVVPSNLWECVGDRIYISSGDSEMYRIADGKVEKVQNGTDDVVFMRGLSLKPWVLQSGEGVDPFAEALIFKTASFASPHGRMIARLWFLNLFKKHRMKPPLLITGRFQSGKTRMAAAMKEIVGTSDLSVQEAEDGDKGLDAFWATVNSGMFEVYDNMDTRIRWVPNTLQIAATNGQTKRRTLYTTYGVSVLQANAHLIVTSNNPLFATELGLADRMMTVRLKSARKIALDTALSDDINARRDEYMTWVARILAKALIDKEPVNESINMRHPEFGAFGVRLARAGGFEAEAVAAMSAAELDKSLLPLQNNKVCREIMAVLVSKNCTWTFSSQDMSEAILKMKSDSGEVDEGTESFFNSRKVGNALNDNWSVFAKAFKVRPVTKVNGKRRYVFEGAAPGMEELVALGDLEGDSAKTPQENHHSDFSTNTSLNPTNPPSSINEDGDDFEIDI